MRSRKFTDSQISLILQQAAAGESIPEICRQHGISVATFYNWRKRFAGLEPAEVPRVKYLEQENKRLKKIIADITLEKTRLQEILRDTLVSMTPGHTDSTDDKPMS